MVIKLLQDVEPLGKCGSEVEVEDERGHRLLGDGSALCVSFGPAPTGGTKVLSEKQARRLEEKK